MREGWREGESEGSEGGKEGGSEREGGGESERGKRVRDDIKQIKVTCMGNQKRHVSGREKGSRVHSENVTETRRNCPFCCSCMSRQPLEGTEWMPKYTGC